MKLLFLQRFRMKTLNRDQGISAEVEDLPQSDYFQWEAVPASLTGTNSKPNIGLSAPSPDNTQTQPEADMQRACQADRLPELLNDGKQVSKGVSLKEEHIKNYEKEDFAEPSGSGTMKRKATIVSK